MGPRHLEILVCRVAMPLELLGALYDATDEEKIEIKEIMDEYRIGLDAFLTAPEKDYGGFRKFLRQNVSLFGDSYELLARMNNSQIKYVLNRIKRGRVEALLERIKNDK